MKNVQYPIPKAKFFDEDKETGEIVGYDIPQQLPNNEIERIRSLPSCLANNSSIFMSDNNIAFFATW